MALNSVSVLVTVLALVICGVLSQSTDVTCATSFSWTANSFGQNPCLVTAYLWEACTEDPSTAYIPDLASIDSSTYPQTNTPTACSCSMVYYNTISACALCQGGQTQAWTSYVESCPTSLITSDASFPESIPGGTTVPAWAYQDVSGTDYFDPNAAEQVAQQGGAAGTGPAEPSGNSGSPTSAPSTPDPTPSASSQGSGSNVADIAGGVGGGVGGLIVLALGAWIVSKLNGGPSIGSINIFNFHCHSKGGGSHA
ncbi:hypothetical protein PsYK624_106700 [Phanerochaete sordida]|uniref:Uncharacterized protein n=1 Tax=Phanerochaete sordida TaxID=48140 RepID=A0A9P3GJ08_9APHY|nr:hypothetical protein PsYK624_106700 [Phanerochaete sordida]